MLGKFFNFFNPFAIENLEKKKFIKKFITRLTNQNKRHRIYQPF